MWEGSRHRGGCGAHLLNWELLREQVGKVGAQCRVRRESGLQGGTPVEEDSCHHQPLKGL